MLLEDAAALPELGEAGIPGAALRDRNFELVLGLRCGGAEQGAERQCECLSVHCDSSLGIFCCSPHERSDMRDRRSRISLTLIRATSYSAACAVVSRGVNIPSPSWVMSRRRLWNALSVERWPIDTIVVLGRRALST